MYLTPQEIHDTHTANLEAWQGLVCRNIDTLHALLGLAAGGGRRVLCVMRDGSEGWHSASGAAEVRSAMDDLIVASVIRATHLAGTHVGDVADIIESRLGDLGRLAWDFHERVRRNAPWEFAHGFGLAISGADHAIEEAAMGMQAMRHAADDVEQEFRRELAAPANQVRRRRAARRAITA